MQPLPGMIEGYAEHFVGRRRELQRLLPKLRGGKLQTVVITGLGGSGKSTIATRLARKLERDDFIPFAVPSKKGNLLSASKILEACGDVFRQAARKLEAQGDLKMAAELRIADQDLANKEIPVDARLRDIIATLNRGRFLVVLDNLEVNLDKSNRRFIDTTLAAFYIHLLNNLSGGSRALITSRYLPAEVQKLPRPAREESLPDFPFTTFLKFMLSDEKVEARYRGKELSHSMLEKLHELLGGTPRFLEQIRDVLRTISASDLSKELAKVRLPAGAEKGVLQEKRDQYCEDIFTSRLFGLFSPKSQKALSKAAVYNVAVNLAALEAVSGEDVVQLQSFVREWQKRAFVYSITDNEAPGLWTVYGLIRSWLLTPNRLSLDDRNVAHKAAGDFLYNLLQKNQLDELSLSPVDCDMEARAQYLAAGEYGRAREVTNRISDFLMRQGVYNEMRWLNEELLR